MTKNPYSNQLDYNKVLDELDSIFEFLDPEALEIKRLLNLNHTPGEVFGFAWEDTQKLINTDAPISTIQVRRTELIKQLTHLGCSPNLINFYSITLSSFAQASLSSREAKKKGIFNAN